MKSLNKRLLFVALILGGLNSHTSLAAPTEGLDPELLKQAQQYLDNNFPDSEKMTVEELFRFRRAKVSKVAVLTRDEVGNLELIEGTFKKIALHTNYDMRGDSWNVPYIVMNTQTRGDIDIGDYEAVDMRVKFSQTKLVFTK